MPQRHYQRYGLTETNQINVIFTFFLCLCFCFENSVHAIWAGFAVSRSVHRQFVESVVWCSRVQNTCNSKEWFSSPWQTDSYHVQTFTWSLLSGNFSLQTVHVTPSYQCPNSSRSLQGQPRVWHHWNLLFCISDCVLENLLAFCQLTTPDGVLLNPQRTRPMDDNNSIFHLNSRKLYEYFAWNWCLIGWSQIVSGQLKPPLSSKKPMKYTRISK